MQIELVLFPAICYRLSLTDVWFRRRRCLVIGGRIQTGRIYCQTDYRQSSIYAKPTVHCNSVLNPDATMIGVAVSSASVILFGVI